jgi:peptidoglycan/xylan/chitin deacetylase (PgdA/CDA1 family)
MKKFIYQVLVFFRVHIFFREVFQKNTFSVLVFHDINYFYADKYFNFLKKNYTIISLADIITAKKNNFSLPTKSLLITFDDGKAGNYKLLPLFKKYEIKPTIFLCSEIVATKKGFWFDYPSIKNNIDEFKKMDNSERLFRLSTLGFHLDNEYESYTALSADQIKEMKPYVDFQAHTKYHPILPNCSYDIAYEEIVGSKASLESKFELNIFAFAYPNGDYSDREINMLRNGGYECAFTTRPGYNHTSTHLFELKRLDPNDTTDFNEFLVKSSGIQSLFSY